MLQIGDRPGWGALEAISFMVYHIYPEVCSFAHTHTHTHAHTHTLTVLRNLMQCLTDYLYCKETQVILSADQTFISPRSYDPQDYLGERPRSRLVICLT